MEKSVLEFFVSFAGNPLSDFLFLSQKRTRVILRNNPILDFTKEMHPKFTSIRLSVCLSAGLSVINASAFLYCI